MALYKTGGNGLARAQGAASGAMNAMGSMTKENQRTEYKPGDPPATQIFSQGVGLTGTANQLWNLGSKGIDGARDIYQRFLAPDAKAAAVKAESGAQAVGQATGPMQNGVQMNSGVQPASELGRDMVNVPDFVAGHDLATQSNAVIGNVADQVYGQAGELASQNLARQMYANPLVDSPDLLAQSSETASKITVPGGEGASGIGGAIGPSVGGVAGGFAGRELGRAIGGDTGAAIGSVAGSLGGAYLGGLAMSELAGSVAGEAGGAVAGAMAGSAVPGLGTLIGTGLGALTSFLF